jgi:hypothetical protein
MYAFFMVVAIALVQTTTVKRKVALYLEEWLLTTFEATPCRPPAA